MTPAEATAVSGATRPRLWDCPTSLRVLRARERALCGLHQLDRTLHAFWDKGLHTLPRSRICKSIRKQSRVGGLLQSPLTDSNRRPPPYHALQTATGRSRRQRFWLVSAVLEPVRFATVCHRLQPRGSIKAPSFVVCTDAGQATASNSASHACICS